MMPAKQQDALLEMKDAGLIAASAAAQVGGADKILDIGLHPMRGDLVIEVTAIEVASTDELYTIRLQGSTSATFASVIGDLAVLRIGAAAAQAGGTDIAGAVTTYVIPFATEIVKGVFFRYLRLYTTVAGTIATGINYKGRLTSLSRGP